MEQMPFRWSLLRLLLRLQPHCGAVGTTVEALSRHFRGTFMKNITVVTMSLVLTVVSDPRLPTASQVALTGTCSIASLR
jgi:hypothetical protein